jgi:hypothetical protein
MSSESVGADDQYLIAHDLQISAARDTSDHIALMLQCGDDLRQRRNGL